MSWIRTFAAEADVGERWVCAFLSGAGNHRRELGPVLVELQLEPAVAPEQAVPEPDWEDLEDARERIAEGRTAEYVQPSRRRRRNGRGIASRCRCEGA